MFSFWLEEKMRENATSQSFYVICTQWHLSYSRNFSSKTEPIILLFSFSQICVEINCFLIHTYSKYVLATTSQFLILFYIFFSFAELCHLFADQLIKKNTPLVGLSPLLKAISKIQMSEKCLTSVHADVARLALASKCFTRPVLSLLEVNYNEISKEATANPKNVLLFFYYGGMISASIKVKIVDF